jgi:ribosomal protein S18 acetylase RimI-like enzyme
MITRSAHVAGDGYVVRCAGELDGPAVTRELAAYLAHIGESFEADGLDHDIAHWRTEYDGVSGALLVLEDPRGEIVGTAGVRTLEPGLGEIKRMWIRPECQGRGLGRRLLGRCVEEARAFGLRTLRLDSERQMGAALHLYRTAGFSEISDYNGNPRAQVWMELTL